MAPPSDRTVRVNKRSFDKIRQEIEVLLAKRTTPEIMNQIEILNDGSLKPTMARFDDAVMEVLLLIDETAQEDLDLETRVLKDQSDVRGTNALLQAKILAASTALKGEEARKSIVPNANSTMAETTRSGGDQPKLKKIEIPEFDGDLSKFFNFKALFSNLVHNNSEFSNVQKLYYLKQALVGKAAIVLQDCDLADDAYPEAWAYFLERFESKRAIVRNFFVKLSTLPQLRSESGIREILDQTMATIRGLKVAGETVNETFSRYISFLVASKLDPVTAKDWDNHTCENSEYPKFEDLFKFLQGRSFVIEERQIEKPKERESTKNVPAKKTFLISNTSSQKCPLCNNQHFLNQCDAFRAMNAHRRYEVVKSNGLCMVCFSKEHNASSCTSKFKCRCGKPHHNLLHFDFKSGSSNPSAKSEAAGPTKENSEAKVAPKQSYTSVVQNGKWSEKVVVLPSALVRFAVGETVGTIRILLDSCAQATMVSDRMIKKFRIPVETLESGSTLGGITPGFVSSNQVARLNLISRSQCFSLEIEAEVVPAAAMAYELYTEIAKENVEKLSKFRLADPALLKQPVRIADVDVILGAEYYEKCIESKTSEVNGLFLRLSKFGWTVSGPCERLPRKFAGLSLKFCGSTVQTIENDLRNYHRVENGMAVESKKETTRCLQHFEKTCRILDDGKFSLELPFKAEKSKVANNRRLALISLFRLEQKLDPTLKQEYVKFVNEYIEMGHASLVEPIGREPSYFIPHRAVIRKESSTTPVRVVFNASSRVKGALALNDALMLGPQTQRELFDILISVRSYRYVFSADVAKMYRMVWIEEKDRDMQRILWRNSPSEEVKEYRLNTVTYGTKPASFMATQCLEMIARKIESTNAEAARMIRENFYMDDLIAGGDDLDELCDTRKVVHNALAAHGFKLRKYSANSPRILSEVPEELLLTGVNELKSEQVAMLGIVWSPSHDGFCVKLNLRLDEIQGKTTKRLMMSVLARTFDPLGLVAPVTLVGKLMIQQLWRAGLDWDEEVPTEIAEEFDEYIGSLSKLQSFVVPRYVCRPGTKTQLVGFCDASAKAYCALLFVRTIDEGRVRSVSLICAKTRVAPSKELTIPKLELSSAELLAKLVDRVRSNLKVDLKDCFLFTDATIVLCWLSHPPDEWKAFVSSRVEKIQRLVPYDHWFYVRTSSNPADLATRGLSVSEFLDSPSWLCGPSFLRDPVIRSNPIPNLDVSHALERRKVRARSVNQVVVHDSLLSRFSSYPRLLRVLAYVVRFCDRVRKRKINRARSPSAAELEASGRVAIRMVQRTYFFEDVDRLSRDMAPKATSRIVSLTPFLDEFGILRVGGRTENAGRSQAKTHPMILHARAHLVRVMLRWIHEKYFHAGRRFMVAHLAARFWIVGGSSNLVKAIVRECVQCTRFKGEAATQLMGQLPAFRVTESQPFSHVGVDLAGPFKCKCVAHRTTRHYKVYMAIFVCMVVKCVHIEIVTDLSTSKFVEALQRFIARRGAPSNMYSDNGTNFVGTRNLMSFNQAEIESFVAAEGISWSMIPPRSPHFGGLWESAVRSAKHHIARVMKGAELSFDEYLTLFTRTEAILNSRPLCLSVGQGGEVLTPGHFLIGRSMVAPPALEVDSHKLLSRKFIELSRRLRSFWKVWRDDYLNQLQRRYKWQSVQPNVQVGQVVLVKDEAPPYQWPLAVVQEVFPDADGVVRVVNLKLSNSSNFSKRAITRLVLLPVDMYVESPPVVEES